MNHFFQVPSNQLTTTKALVILLYGVGPFGELLAYGNDRGNTMMWPVTPPGSWNFTPMDWQVATGWFRNGQVLTIHFTEAPLSQWSGGTGVFLPNPVPMVYHEPNFTSEAPIRGMNATIFSDKLGLDAHASKMVIKNDTIKVVADKEMMNDMKASPSKVRIKWGHEKATAWKEKRPWQQQQKLQHQKMEIEERMKPFVVVDIEAELQKLKKGKEKEVEKVTCTTIDDLVDQIALLPKEWVYSHIL